MTPENARCGLKLPNADKSSSKLVNDPIAQAIQQMEEAARVLHSEVESITMFKDTAKVLKWEVVRPHVKSACYSLSEAIGYTPPDQQREEKLKEAEARWDEAVRSSNKAWDELQKLREEANK